MLVDNIYVVYIQFEFPVYIILYEFLIFMLLKFSLKLIHKKTKSPRREKSMDVGM